LARRFAFEQHNLRTSIAVHTLTSIVVALLHLAAFSFTYVLFKDQVSWVKFVRIMTISVRYLFLVEILTYWTAVGIYLTVHFSNLRRSLAEARLIALRSQLNPHFLFNSLHAISTMSLRGEHREVAEMLGRLSDLLRAAFDGSRQEVPLSDELEFIDHYISLQHIRFGDRLSFEQQIDPHALDALVPTMILQPLVENAIKHGISPQRGGGTVRIIATVADHHLRVAVEDSGAGFDPEDMHSGVGLTNTKARLEQLYGGHHWLKFARTHTWGASVQFGVPFRTTDTETHGRHSSHEHRPIANNPALFKHAP
jgi:signal transduction histidine kinase